MRKVAGLLSSTAVIVGVWACSDMREPTNLEVDPQQSTIQAAPPSQDCNVVRGLKDDARDYLSNPYEGQVIDQLNIIEPGTCSDPGDAAAAWQILSIIEAVLAADAGGAAADGVSLVNGTLFIVNGVQGGVTEAVLGIGGGYGVRSADSVPVISRDPVSLTFSAEGGGSVTRPAVIAVRPQHNDTWDDVAVNGITLITAYPNNASSFALDEWPNLGFQSGQQVDVIICFTDMNNASIPDDPHPSGEANYAATLKKNGTVILENVGDAEQFCATQVMPLFTQAETPLSSLTRMASNLIMPEPLGAYYFHDSEIGGEGGSPFTFSTFGLSNALSHGTLQFVQGPPRNVNGTSPNGVFTVKVQALSGGNVGVELIDIVLTVTNNNGIGEMEGVWVNCNGVPQSVATGCTTEASNGVAEITVSINSPGAYTMCANASDQNTTFTFPQRCTGKFNVKPN